MKKITKVGAARKVIEENGGVASWRYIYDNIEKYYPTARSTENWQAGIRGVVYRDIRGGKKNLKQHGLSSIGLYEYEQEEQIQEIKKDKIRMHSYIEGIMVELGNYEKYDTHCADPSAKFQENIAINQLTTIKDFPQFTYADIIKISKRIDVIWFNKNGYQFPQKIVEVVDSIGTISDSLSRMYQLKEFKSEFLILHPKIHKQKIDRMIEREPYSIMKDRFVIKNYEEIINYYNKRVELEQIKFY